jgi:HTH-type transcriptional regulator, sugar sensing transcriptional regulator
MQTEMVEQLLHLGLTRHEAQIFLTILRAGEITAREISKNLGIHRGVVYQSLAKLRNFGMIENTLSNPSKSIVINSNDALKNLVLMKKNDYVTSQKISEDIMSELHEISNPTQKMEESFLSIIQGRFNVYNKIGKILENSKNTVYVISPEEDIAKLYYTSIPEKIKICSKKVDVRILTNSASQMITPILKSFGTNNIKLKKNLQNCRIVLEIDNQVLISNDLKNTQKKSIPDTAIFTNSPDIVNSFSYLCDLLWSKASEF